MNEECYICEKEFRDTEGVYQLGRNTEKFTSENIGRHFCCYSCAKRGKRNFLISLVLICAIQLTVFYLYVL